jgi:hypothetical protein
MIQMKGFSATKYMELEVSVNIDRTETVLAPQVHITIVIFYKIAE